MVINAIKMIKSSKRMGSKQFEQEDNFDFGSFQEAPLSSGIWAGVLYHLWCFWLQVTENSLKMTLTK